MPCSYVFALLRVVFTLLVSVKHDWDAVDDSSIDLGGSPALLSLQLSPFPWLLLSSTTKAGPSSTLVAMFTKSVKQIILVGSGASVPTPSLQCLLSPKPCPQCIDADTNLLSRNRRGNSSIFLRGELLASPPGSPTSGEAPDSTHVLVDCGKTFRDAVARQLIARGVKRVDAIVLSHHHADAIMGLDDIRELSQPGNRAPMPVYCDASTQKIIQSVFPYLYPPGPNEPKKPRWTGVLDIRTVTEREQFHINQLPILPMSFDHGDCRCLGFFFPTSSNSWSLYASDVASINTEEHDHIQRFANAPVQVESSSASSSTLSAPNRRQQQLDFFFVDCLTRLDRPNPAHFNDKRALEAARKVGAKRTVFVGMSHTLDYTDFSKYLESISNREGYNTLECGYDGWSWDA
jgi:phosphoribosyl 1,2-cyclic phosphodiesterase